MQRNVWRRETSLFPETGSTPRNTHCYMMVTLFLCLRKMFYNTLGIDEKQVRTVMKNNTDTGAPVKEKVGIQIIRPVKIEKEKSSSTLCCLM